MSKNIAKSLAARYCTTDPFRIAEALNIHVLFIHLTDEVNGFVQRYRRGVVIYINNTLSESKQRLVCAHELGHAVLHKGMNRFFMDAHTLMVPGKYEKEAWRFAVDLLWSDDDLREYWDCTIPQIADALGISYELAEYRMLSVPPSFY